MAKFRTLDDIDVSGKTVLLRADLNVPVKDGKVTDATRIERLAPTIKVLTGKGARVVVMSHFGRPKGKPDLAFSLRLLVEPLEKAIGGRHVAFAADCVGDEAKRVVAALQPGQVALLENLRFHKGEEASSPILPGRWPNWAISMSTMHFPQRIARMLRSKRSHICCRLPPES